MLGAVLMHPATPGLRLDGFKPEEADLLSKHVFPVLRHKAYEMGQRGDTLHIKCLTPVMVDGKHAYTVVVFATDAGD